MTKTFTQDDVIRFVYDEMSAEEARELSQVLFSDPALESRYNELVALKAQIDGAAKNPSDAVVNRILNYSKSLHLPSTK
jgi:anti-sigma factor RsiW